MTINFLSDVQVEGMAGRWLGHNESISGAVAGPPVPVERILRNVLATIRRSKRT